MTADCVAYGHAKRARLDDSAKCSSDSELEMFTINSKSQNRYHLISYIKTKEYRNFDLQFFRRHIYQTTDEEPNERYDSTRRKRAGSTLSGDAPRTSPSSGVDEINGI